MSRLKLAAAVALLACVIGATTSAAYATFTRSGSATQAISTQTLQPPTGAAATLTSQCKSSKAQQVTVTWTASISAFTTGYTILATYLQWSSGVTPAAVTTC